jgi:hypothetical protein
MSRTINLLLSILFVIIGFFMAFIGATVLANGPSNETEWTIGIMGMGSAILLFYGAYKTVKGQKKQDEAERKESVRLAKRYSSAPPKSPKSEGVEVPSGEPGKEHEVELLEPNLLPEILVRWTYTPTAWRLILLKLAEKTRKEEFYTAFWFPVLFAIVFFSQWYYGVILGIFVGWLYIRFRVYFIKQKFALKPGQQEAEVIISDSYLRVNNNFINYADDKYFLKQLNLEQDEKLGEMLHFTIGWVTSKGYPAEMDLYLPIPIGHVEEAESVLSAFKAARS